MHDMEQEVNKISDFTILFIDDSKEILDAFVRMFAWEQFNVLTAEKADEALDIIDKQTPGVIVLDIKMPDVHGLELIEEIRKRDSEVPIIIFTAFRGMKEDFIVKTYNITEYYIKPGDYNRLYKKVQEIALNKIMEWDIKQNPT